MKDKKDVIVIVIVIKTKERYRCNCYSNERYRNSVVIVFQTKEGCQRQMVAKVDNKSSKKLSKRDETFIKTLIQL